MNGIPAFTPNMTSNTLPVPEKGMMESLFGGGDKAAAEIPASSVLPGQQQIPGAGKPEAAQTHGSFEDLIKQLAMETQDQKEVPQKEATATAAATAAAAALAKAQLAAQTKDGSKKAENVSAEAKAAIAEKKEEPAKADPQASVQLSGMIASQLPVQPQQPKVIQSESQSKPVEAQAAKQAQVVQAQTVAQQQAGQPKLASSPEAIAVSQEIKRLQSSLTRSSPQAASSLDDALVVQQPVIMLQPVILTGPMAFEVTDMQEQEAPMMVSHPQPAPSPMVFSQDFVAGHGGQILGVDRPDPRLMGRVSDEDKSQGNNLGLMLPQVGNHFNGSNKIVDVAPASTPTPMTKMDVANPTSIATQVQNLAMSGGGKVKVSVTPENLGEVTISVSQGRDRKLDVKFEASTLAGKEALANALPELRQALTSSRYDVGRLEVGATSSISQVSAMVSPSGDTAMWNAFSQSQFGSFEQGGGQGNQQQDSQGGSAWDRYNAQQESRQEHSSGRQRSGYRRYLDAEMTG